jgi:hypothetical protein
MTDTFLGTIAEYLVTKLTEENKLYPKQNTLGNFTKKALGN